MVRIVNKGMALALLELEEGNDFLLLETRVEALVRRDCIQYWDVIFSVRQQCVTVLQKRQVARPEQCHNFVFMILVTKYRISTTYFFILHMNVKKLEKQSMVPIQFQW